MIGGGGGGYGGLHSAMTTAADDISLSGVREVANKLRDTSGSRRYGRINPSLADMEQALEMLPAADPSFDRLQLVAAMKARIAAGLLEVYGRERLLQAQGAGDLGRLTDEFLQSDQ